ncbi:hypothetical protein BDR03DRAFT_953054 [Suillus americanus]|nr:hypothetical protein BDR03DRAFT_953054 [Suillus americanus]
MRLPGIFIATLSCQCKRVGIHNRRLGIVGNKFGNTVKFCWIVVLQGIASCYI